MKTIHSLIVVSVALFLSLVAGETMEEFYCTPIREFYPIKRDGMEILKADRALHFCATDCTPTETEEVWTKFVVKEGGEETTKKAYAINVLACRYDGWTGKVGP